MKKIILGFAIALSFSAYAGERQAYSTERRVYTYKVSLMTNDGRHIVDSVSAESENDARNIIRDRYPNCVIFAVYKIG
jgi:hypothetical protein